MTQDHVAGLIVLLAALYALWYWLPPRWRRRLLRRSASEPMAAAGCGSCSGCADDCAAAPRSTEWHTVSVSKTQAAQSASSEGRP